MKRGAVVNLLIGLSIALLPLYNRVAEFDFNRTSKDNLLVILLGLLGFLLPSSVRKMSLAMYAALVYGLFFLVFNQWNVLSINVMFQVFYTASALLFFAHFYEKHDEDSTDLILFGMASGALIQSFFAIPEYFDIFIYPEFAAYFSIIDVVKNPINETHGAIGTLGNSGMLASYLALTTLSFLKIKNKWLMIFPIIALLMTHSLIGIASLLVGFLYYLNTKVNFVNKTQIYTSATISMFLLFVFGIGGDSGRYGAWKAILLNVDISHFFIGKGAGWFADKKQLIADGTLMAQEHNAFLTVFNFFGIIGLLLLVLTFINFLTSKSTHPIFSSILFVAFCNSFGHFTLHQSTVVIIIIITASICMAEGNSYGRDMDGF